MFKPMLVLSLLLVGGFARAEGLPEKGDRFHTKNEMFVCDNLQTEKRLVAAIGGQDESAAAAFLRSHDDDCIMLKKGALAEVSDISSNDGMVCLMGQEPGKCWWSPIKAVRP